MRLRAASLPIEFACYAKSCAPPPVGDGGSIRKAVRGLNVPDSGFTLSTKLVSLRSGFAVAIGGSDRLVSASDGFKDGQPSEALVRIVRDRITASVNTPRPPGTKLALGGWHNPEDGKIEINVTVVFPKNREAAAMEFARQQDQIAIFALHRGEVIMTGGTGGDRQTE